MAAETTRTHVVLPKRLVAEVDERVGQRRRSEFIAEAAAEKLACLRRLEAAKAAGGSLASVEVPGWETPGAVTEWVTALRHAADARDADSRGDR